MRLYTYGTVRTVPRRDEPHEKRDRERVEILGELHGEVMVFQPLSIKEISLAAAWSRPPFRSTSTRFTTSG